MSTPSTKRPFSVALTGGIASGKSAAAACFERLGAPVFDADLAAREMVAPGQPALSEISGAFGAQMLTPDGALDRARMRELVFGDADARRRLEGILHPRIRQRLRAQAEHCADRYCILAIPLFVEARADYRWLDRVLVIDVPRDTQIARLLLRPGVDAQLARMMLDAQANREQRLQCADDVIDNAGPLISLGAAVARLHEKYLNMAGPKPAAR